MFGFFSKKKAKPSKTPQAEVHHVSSKEMSAEEEFEMDLKAAMAHPATACRQDIAEMLWAKYEKLQDNIKTSDDFHRMYDLVGHTVGMFQWPLEAVLWMADVCEGVLKRPEQAAHWFKVAADQGHPRGAHGYADLVMVGAVEGDPVVAHKYYQQASDGGIAVASFVMGEYFNSQGKREEALTAYRKAVEQGFPMAQMRIDQMEADA